MNKLKTELAIVHLTTDNKKILHIKDAVEHQGILQKHKEKKMEEHQMIVDVKQLIEEVLNKNYWGIYFKAEPITSLPVQDKSKMYKVNDVTIDRLMDSIDEVVNQSKENQWRDRKQSTNLDEKL